MNFDFSFLATAVIVAWSASATGLGVGNLLLAGLILFSHSLPVSILALISLTLLSFFVTSSKSRRSATSHTQRAYGLRLLCLFVALTGAALESYEVSSLLVFLGLLASLPIFLWSILFSKYYEATGLRSYLYSVIIPAIATLDILLKSKVLIKSDWAPWWDAGLISMGVATALFGAWLSFTKNRTKLKLIYLAQVWVGLAMLLLVAESDKNAHLALTAIACLVVTMPVLISYASQLALPFRTAAQVVALGLPGFLTFSALYYSVKTIVGFNVHWIWVFAVIYLFQALSLCMGGDADTEVETPGESKNLKLKFFLLMAVQLLASLAIYWIDVEGLK
jgi:hypothetical protein